MRGFLIFLAVAAPILLLHPTFWWLVQSEVGAAPSVMIEADGARRDSFIGPRSPAPDWTVLPAGAHFTPRAYYGPAPGKPAQGYGEIALAQSSRPAAAQLQQTLSEQGWEVSAVRYRVAEPSIPPRPLLLCMVTARRVDSEGERTLLYGFQLEPAARSGTVHWVDGPPMTSWQTPDTLPEWTEPRPGCD